MPYKTLPEIQTPALILDLDRVERNCHEMIEHTRRLGVRLRPHLKTAKCAEIARLATAGNSEGITVSTLSEVEYFASAGFLDITYAVGIVPQKIAPLARLMERYPLRISLLADSEAVIVAIADEARRHGQEFPVFVEIDCGAGRGGVEPGAMELMTIARAIDRASHLSLAGVLTHAGQSYGAKDPEEIAAIAEDERQSVVLAATRLRAAGLEVPCVSLGSTPTVIMARSLEGIDEVRPGVYTLFDLDQHSLGVCTLKDIAASVLTTVIGHNARSQSILIDAGALALSKDASARDLDMENGFGLICAETGDAPLPGLRVTHMHQEHGFVTAPGADFDALRRNYPIGTRLRVLPSHACLTAAPYDAYHLVRGTAPEVVGRWTKNSGWS